jgi:ATP-dependent RNA helicase DeaD
MPAEVFTHLKNVWVSGQKLQIAEWNGQEEAGSSAPPPPRRFTGNKPQGKKPYLGKKPPRKP